MQDTFKWLCILWENIGYAVLSLPCKIRADASVFLRYLKKCNEFKHALKLLFCYFIAQLVLSHYNFLETLPTIGLSWGKHLNQALAIQN